MTLRPYQNDRDREAAHRIWRETGWIERGHEPSLDLWLGACRSWVAEIDGEAECLVLTCPGTVRYLDDDLPMSCVAGVTTSRIARKQGFAARLTARAVAADAADGAAVSALGMFEQGFYNRLGFGTGTYEHLVGLHPSALSLGDVRARVPRRLSSDDWEAVHASRLRRRRGHGACNLEHPQLTRGELMEHKNGFGLGYRDGSDLTHHFWCSVPDDVEHGPYRVEWMAWRTPQQLLELLALLRNLGDQVALLRIREPAGIQLQDFLQRPFHWWNMSERGRYEGRVGTCAYWQMRICDLPACLERTRLPGGETRFNLSLADPIETHLAEDAPWRGVAGEYVVTLGASSGAEPGRDPSLPTMTASVNAFTRLWLGVRPAWGLAVTDDLDAPPELLEALDGVLRLPPPHPDWDF